jgi:hypothetical protein
MRPAGHHHTRQRPTTRSHLLTVIIGAWPGPRHDGETRSIPRAPPLPRGCAGQTPPNSDTFVVAGYLAFAATFSVTRYPFQPLPPLRCRPRRAPMMRGADVLYRTSHSRWALSAAHARKGHTMGPNSRIVIHQFLLSSLAVQAGGIDIAAQRILRVCDRLRAVGPSHGTNRSAESREHRPRRHLRPRAAKDYPIVDKSWFRKLRNHTCRRDLSRNPTWLTSDRSCGGYQ